MANTSGYPTDTSDLQRQLSQSMWDRKRAGSDPFAARRIERRIAVLLDEFAAAVLLRLSDTDRDEAIRAGISP
jgi:hypothetical protein